MIAGGLGPWSVFERAAVVEGSRCLAGSACHTNLACAEVVGDLKRLHVKKPIADGAAEYWHHAALIESCPCISGAFSMKWLAIVPQDGHLILEALLERPRGHMIQLSTVCAEVLILRVVAADQELFLECTGVA